MLPHLAERGCRPEGLDLSEAMIHRARLDHPGFSCDVGTLKRLEYDDDAFDGVFSWYSTIHHPDEDLDRMVGEMARVLKPGGLLLVAFQSGEGMRRVGEGFAALGFEVVLNRHHRSLEYMAARLAEHGLDVVARLEREAMGDEEDPQAVVLARKPGRPHR